MRHTSYMTVNFVPHPALFFFWSNAGTSLAVQWLRLCTSTAGGMGLIPGQGTKIPHAAPCGQKKRNSHHKAVSSKSL